MAQNTQQDEKKIVKWTKDHWIAVIGIMIGIAIPLWQTYWVQRS